MQRMLTSTLAVLSLFLAAALAPALAQQGPGPGAGPGLRAGAGGDESPALRAWWKDPRVIERLGLNPDQQKKIDALAYKSGERFIDLHADKQKAQLTLAHLLAAETLDDAAIDKAAEQLTATMCAIGREEISLRADIARVLTRDQRLALASLRDMREGRGGGRMGRGMRR